MDPNAILGTNSKTIIVAGRAVALAPLTLGMMAEAMKYQREKPFEDMIALGCRSQMPKDVLYQTLRDMRREQVEEEKRQAAAVKAGDDLEGEGGDSSMFEMLLHLAWLRLRHDKVTLEDVRAVPVDQMAPIMDAMTEDIERVNAIGKGAQKKRAAAPETVDEMASPSASA